MKTENEKRRSRKALLVGVNEYADPRIPVLRGCLNDVTNIVHVLKMYFGFENRDIRALTDTMATGEQIMRGLEWLMSDAGPGDLRVFHFSGHGSQVPDEGGDDVDGLDEILCPYDIDWNAKRYITDDMLAECFAALAPGAHLEVILDCCHSGGASRALVADGDVRTPIGESRIFQVRYLTPPLGIQLRRDGREDAAARRRRKLAAKGEQGSRAIWSAAGENESSADAIIDGRAAGAFTHYFCKHVRAERAKEARSKVLQRVRASLRTGRFGHAPRLEANEGLGRSGVFQPVFDEGTRNKSVRNEEE